MKKKVLGCGIVIAALSLFGVMLFRFGSVQDNDNISPAENSADGDAAQDAGQADDDAGSEGPRYMLKEEDFNPEIRGISCLYFEEKSFIYSISSEQEDFPHYYRYYFDSGEKVFLGEIPDYFIGIKNGQTRLGDGIYFFAGVGGGASALFCIDLNENTVKRCCEYKDGSVPVNIACGYQEEIATVKRILDRGVSMQTVLEFYNPETNEWVIQKSELCDYNRKNGTELTAFYAAKEKLYIIQEKYTDNGRGAERRLILYDGNMEQEKEYVLREGMERSTRSMGSGSELSVNGKLVYVKNWKYGYYYGYLGIMREDRIETIMELEEELIKVYGESGKYGDGNLFFRRGADILYLFDQETEQLLQISLSLNEGETLRRVFVDGDYIMMVCYAKDENNNNLPDRMYVMPIDTIICKTFP